MRRSLTALVAAALLMPAAGAAVIVVGDPGAATVQAAVDLALANGAAVDTVRLPSGNWKESVVIAFAGAADAQQHLTLAPVAGAAATLIGQLGSPAITVQDAAGVTLQGLVLDSGNALDAVPALLVTSSRNVRGRELRGVPGDDLGVVVLGATTTGVRFDDCEFSALLGIGFWLEGMGHELAGCRASACGLNGIVLGAGSFDCTLRDCRAEALGGSNTAAPGVVTVRGNGHRLLGTTAAGGGLDGFHVQGKGHVLEACRGTGNARAGFHLDGATALLSGCVANTNLFGLLGGGPAATVDGGSYGSNASHGALLLAGGVRLASVVLAGNGGHGIYVRPGVEQTLVRGCKLKANNGEGVFVEGTRTWVEGNVATKGDGLVDAGSGNAGRDNQVQGGAANDF